MANFYAAYRNGFGGHFSIQIFGSYAERKQFLSEHGGCDAISADEARSLARAYQLAVTHDGATIPESWNNAHDTWLPLWEEPDWDGNLIYDLISR